MDDGCILIEDDTDQHFGLEDMMDNTEGNVAKLLIKNNRKLFVHEQNF